MLKKRLIGVVTVKQCIAVQSFGYRRFLPLGKPSCLVENLDRWGADEILIQVIDRSSSNLGPDFKLIEQLGALGLETPLIYGGGIRSLEDGLKIIHLGADRIVIDTLIHENRSVIKLLTEHLGAQAIIASLPLCWEKNSLLWLNYRKRLSQPISEELCDVIYSGLISEILISDWMNEGQPGQFEKKLIEELPFKDTPIIAFGGIYGQQLMRELYQMPQIVGLAIGNFLSYREHAIQRIKDELSDCPIRTANYKSQFNLGSHV